MKRFKTLQEAATQDILEYAAELMAAERMVSSLVSGYCRYLEAPLGSHQGDGPEVPFVTAFVPQGTPVCLPYANSDRVRLTDTGNWVVRLQVILPMDQGHDRMARVEHDLWMRKEGHGPVDTAPWRVGLVGEHLNSFVIPEQAETLYEFLYRRAFAWARNRFRAAARREEVLLPE